MITYERLKQIIPADQALACKAISVSLQQVKNIVNLDLPTLANSCINTVTTRNLSLINALTQPVPASVAEFYSTNYATGSGPDGTLVLTDMLGACVGVTYIDQLNNCVSIINSMTTLTTLTSVYSRMANTVNGVYGNTVTGPIVIPAGPAAGTYADADAAFQSGLIPSAVSAIGNVVATDAANTTLLNTEFNTMAQKVINENTNLSLASIDVLTLLSTNRGPVMSFVQAIPDYGLDKTQNGAAWVLEQVADTTTLGGQAIVGCLREGQNIAVLNAAGIGQDTAIPSTPSVEPPTANLISSTYSTADADNLVIK
jgi:hypothetical protein